MFIMVTSSGWIDLFIIICFISSLVTFLKVCFVCCEYSHCSSLEFAVCVVYLHAHTHAARWGRVVIFLQILLIPSLFFTCCHHYACIVTHNGVSYFSGAPCIFSLPLFLSVGWFWLLSAEIYLWASLVNFSFCLFYFSTPKFSFGSFK